MVDILLYTVVEARQLAGSIIMAKAVLLQTEYMGNRKISVSVHKLTGDITENLRGIHLRNMRRSGCLSDNK